MYIGRISLDIGAPITRYLGDDLDLTPSKDQPHTT